MDFISIKFDNFNEFRGWLEVNKGDTRAVYFYGFLEAFAGDLYTVADMLSDIEAFKLNEGAIEIYKLSD